MTIDATTSFRAADGEAFGAELLRLHEWIVHKDPSTSYPVDAAVLQRIVPELARLRAERQPFKVMMDATLEANGFGKGTCSEELLELAERLGFLQPRLATVREDRNTMGRWLLFVGDVFIDDTYSMVGEGQFRELAAKINQHGYHPAHASDEANRARPVGLGDRLLLSGIGAPVDARVIGIRNMPVALSGGLPSIRRGTCSISIVELQT